MNGHLGFSYVGLLFLSALFIPNIIWTKNLPQRYLFIYRLCTSCLAYVNI